MLANLRTSCAAVGVAAVGMLTASTAGIAEEKTEATTVDKTKVYSTQASNGQGQASDPPKVKVRHVFGGIRWQFEPDPGTGGD